LNRIPGILRVGVGAGGGTVAGASVLAHAVCKQAVRRHQAEAAAPR
jgi:hypothetical protein